MRSSLVAIKREQRDGRSGTNEKPAPLMTYARGAPGWLATIGNACMFPHSYSQIEMPTGAQNVSRRKTFNPKRRTCAPRAPEELDTLARGVGYGAIQNTRRTQATSTWPLLPARGVTRRYAMALVLLSEKWRSSCCRRESEEVC
jgi:hypothetical protein